MKCPKCLFENPRESTYCGKCATRLDSSREPGDRRPAVTETFSAPREDLTTGSTFAGRFQVIEELGQGGMGRVYKVHDTKVGEKIALKLIRPEAGLNAQSLERFSNELKLARKIRHKNVCQMFDLGEDQGVRYITMEYVRGEDLRQLIRKVGRLSPGQTVGIARQVCAGLEEAHGLGVVHRDLKPQNIMLDEDGNARIMDFGIARSLTGKSITGAGTFIGTPDYVSPEQAEGKDVDQRSDIYSLGVMLYEMATGRRPFDGDTALSILHKHKYESPEDPGKVNPQVPASLARIILKCLEKNKAARYESARALDADLAGIEEGLPAAEKAGPKKDGLTTRDITVTFNVRKLVVPALAVLAMAAAAVFLFKAVGGRKPAPLLAPSSGKPSLAVMYFDNQTDKPGLDRMLVTLLTTNLSRDPEIEVTSTLRLFDILKLLGRQDAAAVDRSLATEVATRAGVETMLLGSIVQIGGRIRLASDLIDVKTGSIRGTQAADGTKYDDLFSMVDAVTEQVGRQIGRGKPRQELRVADATTSSLDALDYYQKGLGLLLRGNYPAAAELLKKAVEIDPTFALAHATLAAAQGGNSMAAFDPATDLTEAQQTLGSAIKYADRVTEGERLGIRMIEAVLDRDLPKAAGFGRELLARKIPIKFAYYIIAIDLWNRHDFAGALRTLEDLLGQDPSDGIAYNMTAYSHGYLGDHPAAILAARKGIAANPDLSAPYESAWSLSMMAGQYDEAIRYSDEAMKVDPAWTWFDALAGQALVHKGRGDEARERFRRLAERSPAWAPRAVFDRGLSYLREGRRREAEAEFRGALDLYRKSGRALDETRCRLGLGLALAIRGKFDEAQAQFKEAETVSGRHYKHDFNPTPIFGRLFSGMAFVKEGRLDRAAAEAGEISSYIARKKMAPVYFDSYYPLEAAIAVSQGRPKEALGSLDRMSLFISHFSAFFWLAKASAEEALGLYQPAAESYGKFLGWVDIGSEFRADSVWSYHELSMVDYNLGRIAEKTGNPAGARDHYRKFLEGMKAADPGIPEVADAQKRLAALKPEPPLFP
jgi:serine/threonine protein kinase/tetratricopeptide (TPR) repeat protein